MSNTHVYGILGDAHVRGSGGGSGAEGVPGYGADKPLVMGQSEQQLYFLLGHGDPEINSVVTQTVPPGVNMRARVTHVINPTKLIVEPLVENSATTLAALLFDTIADVTITEPDGTVLTKSLTSYDVSQLPELLNDPELEASTTDSVYWDDAAMLAQTVDIDNFNITATEAVYPGDRLTASSGATFTVAGISQIDDGAGTARLHIVGLDETGGTLAETNTLSSAHTGITLVGVSVATLGASPSAGAWVQYCPTPAIGQTIDELGTDADAGSIGSLWDVLPRGNGRGSQYPLLGPDIKIVPNAVAAHAGADETADQGVRVFSASSTDDVNASGVDAGVHLQKVELSGAASGTFTPGEPISSSGTWSATVANHDVGSEAVPPRSNDIIFVYDTNGETLANTETLTGATSGETGTASGAAIGWQKGSSYWNYMSTQLSASQSASGYLHESSAAKWERLFMMAWEGELGPYNTTNGATLIAYMAVNADIFPRMWGQFVSDFRTLVGNSSMPVRVWIHHKGAQSNGVISPTFLAIQVRNNLTALPDTIDNLSVVDSFKRGHQMQQEHDVGVDEGGDGELYLRTMDYVDLGQALWNGSHNRTISAPDGNLQILPVGVVAGSQSQFVGYSIYNSDVAGTTGVGMAYVDKDPELWPSASFIDGSGNIKDTTDPSGLVWNFDQNELEVYDVNLNDNTFHEAINNPYTANGPTVSLMQRMKMRYGDGTRPGLFAMFKGAKGGSCLSPDVRAASGCWQPNMAPRPADSIEVTVTRDGDNAVFTATTPGSFSERVGDGSRYTVVISGGAASQGAGGRNSKTLSYNFADSIDADSFIVGDPGEDIATGTETLTFTWGPPGLWSYFEEHWKAFTIRCIEKGYFPRPVFLLQDQAESDLLEVASYKQYLDEFWTALESLCGYREDTSDSDITKCIVQLHKYTPFADATPEAIAQMRGLQSTKASTLSNCVLVDPSALPLEDVRATHTQITVDPPYPRLYRLDNGIHLTAIGMLTKGYMADEAMGGVSLIASHPFSDDISVAYGATNGTGRLEEEE